MEATELNHPASADSIEQLTSLNKALADSLRLLILRLLKSESFGVLELSRILDVRQSALSHHLKILANANLVSTRREGNSIFYRRVFVTGEDPYRSIKESVFDLIDDLPLAAQSQKKIKQIQLERAQLSLNFFNRNADKFREQQGLIVAHGDYAPSLHDVIAGLDLTPAATVMEVGPGEGQLLLELANRFDRITALDNSREMLDKSRQAIVGAGFDNVQFVLGDTAIANKRGLACDLIVFDMVMHHISSPAKTFKDCAAMLHQGGYLLLIDLCTHDQDWVRESCGDLWLGFDEADLNRWADEASLSPGQNSFLALRNGFQIQIRGYQKNS